MIFRPGVDAVPVSGKMFDQAELDAGCRAVNAGWWTAGPETQAFERELAQFVGVRDALFVNSGSSANLAAISALTSPELGEQRLKPGDEVITCAAGFPTTANPIIQNGLVPVFVDAKLPTYNLDESQLEAAWSDKTRAVMVSHTLGNTAGTFRVFGECKARGGWLVEDSCDALGSVPSTAHMAGRIGDLATFSFYPAHHITTGEGGAVVSDNPKLMKAVRSFAEWGRDCWCATGCDNTCGRRFSWEFGGMPSGYDHKYTYSHLGYNLKATDMQAAIGREQLKKLPGFIAARNRNHAALTAGLKHLEEFFILPEAEPGSDPAWFGFALTVRDGAPFTRAQIVRHLEERKIATRPVFAGNITRQPAYRGAKFRTVGALPVADKIMHDSFWIGCWPGITDEMCGYMIESVTEFCKEHGRTR